MTYILTQRTDLVVVRSYLYVLLKWQSDKVRYYLFATVNVKKTVHCFLTMVSSTTRLQSVSSMMSIRTPYLPQVHPRSLLTSTTYQV